MLLWNEERGALIIEVWYGFVKDRGCWVSRRLKPGPEHRLTSVHVQMHKLYQITRANSAESLWPGVKADHYGDWASNKQIWFKAVREFYLWCLGVLREHPGAPRCVQTLALAFGLLRGDLRLWIAARHYYNAGKWCRAACCCLSECNNKLMQWFWLSLLWQHCWGSKLCFLLTKLWCMISWRNKLPKD